MVADAGSGVAIGDLPKMIPCSRHFYISSNPRQNPTAASFLISSICQPFILRRTGGVTKDVCDDGMQSIAHITHTSLCTAMHLRNLCRRRLGFDALI
jgi:hypothetical protein